MTETVSTGGNRGQNESYGIELPGMVPEMPPFFLELAKKEKKEMKKKQHERLEIKYRSRLWTWQ